MAALALAIAAMLLSVRLTAEQWDVAVLPLSGPRRLAPRAWLPQPVPVPEPIPLALPEQVRSKCSYMALEGPPLLPQRRSLAAQL